MHAKSNPKTCRTREVYLPPSIGLRETADPTKWKILTRSEEFLFALDGSSCPLGALLGALKRLLGRSWTLLDRS